jgi:hypothetical protein
LGKVAIQHPPEFGAATVEAEGEFVEAIVEMLMLGSSLQRSYGPPLERRGHLVDARHDDMGWISADADHGDVVA